MAEASLAGPRPELALALAEPARTTRTAIQVAVQHSTAEEAEEWEPLSWAPWTPLGAIILFAVVSRHLEPEAYDSKKRKHIPKK